jgi:hypothetical protein
VLFRVTFCVFLKGAFLLHSGTRNPTKIVCFRVPRRLIDVAPLVAGVVRNEKGDIRNIIVKPMVFIDIARRWMSV